MSFKDKFQLLNKGELVLYRMLCKAAPSLIVFSQVSMSQIFFIGKLQKDRHVLFNDIGLMSVDFLLCREDASIVLAIELNGPDHAKPAQIERDKRKEAALSEAGIPLLVLFYDDLNNEKTLSQLVAKRVSDRLKIWDARKSEKEKQKYFCSSCKVSVSDDVAKFCWSDKNKTRFNNKIFCIACQSSSSS